MCTSSSQMIDLGDTFSNEPCTYVNADVSQKVATLLRHCINTLHKMAVKGPLHIFVSTSI